MIARRNAYLSELAEMLQAELIGPDHIVHGLGWTNSVSEYEALLSFVTKEKYLKQVAQNSKIKGLIVNKNLLRYWQQGDYRENKSFILTEQRPMVAFYRLHNLLYEASKFYETEIRPVRGTNCRIHDSAFIEDGVVIGNNVTVGPNTSIYSGTVIKDNVYIEANCVIGEAGFQVVEIDDKLETVRHVGGVLVEEGVRIKAFCTIDKELFEGHTRIGPYTHVDSQVCISHGTSIGRNCMIGRMSNLCGNVWLGDNVWIAPSVTIGFSVRLEHNVRVNIGSIVVSNAKEGEEISGYYGMPHQSWMMKYKDELKHYVHRLRD